MKRKPIALARHLIRLIVGCMENACLSRSPLQMIVTTSRQICYSYYETCIQHSLTEKARGIFFFFLSDPRVALIPGVNST